jgi:hypothetical protein
MINFFPILVVLLFTLLSDSTLAQPLDVGQYDALMNVYDGIGVSPLSHDQNVPILFFSSFFRRLQLDNLPSIQFVVELYTTGLL